MQADMKPKNSSRGISPGRLIKSFGYALRGLCRAFRQEQNMRVHLLAALGVTVAGCGFRIAAMEWIALVTVAGCVIASETFNTSIEALSNMISPEYSENIKHVKDFAAGAVLVSAIAAAIVGLIVFIPKILTLFGT
jgi:diacylglycerol kinase (ATP)